MPPVPSKTTTPKTTADPAAEAPPKKENLSPDQLAGVRALFATEFPNTKYAGPKGDAEKPEPEEKEGETPEASEGELPEAPERDEKGHFLKKPAPARKAAAKAPAAVKPKAKPAATLPPAAAPVPYDPEKIAEAAARGVVKGMTEAKTVTEKTEAKAKEETLTPSDRRKVEVLRHLATLQPEKYKDTAETFIKGALALKDYATKWEADHPGQQFDAESPEHEDFFDKAGAFEDWDENDYIEAVADMRVQKVLEKVKPGVDPRVETLERKLKLMESSADIGQKQTAAAVAYWGLLGEDLADIVAENGSVNQVKLAELQKTQPGNTQVRLQAAKALNAEVAEITKVYGGLATFSPEINPIHRAIQDFGIEMEEAMAAAPAEERLNQNGKPWVPSAKYNAMTDEQRAECWTLSGEDLIALRTQRMAKMVKDSIAAREQAFREEAKARGIEIPEPDGAPAEAPEGEQAPARPLPRQVKPVSPSASPDTRGAATRAGRGAPAGSGTPSVGALL